MTGGRQRLWIVAGGTLLEGGLGLLAVLLGILLDEPAATTWHWRTDAFFLGVVAALPMLMGFFVCVRWPFGPLVRIKAFCEEVIRPLFARCSLLELALIATAAGIGEELLFRGLLQAWVGRWLGTVSGCAVASVLFGLCHAITATYAVLAALLGVYLGVWWLATENLLVVIVAHAVYDAVALAYLVRR